MKHNAPPATRHAMMSTTAALLAVLASQGALADVVRHKIPGSDFPISLAVEIPASATVVHLSGQIPATVDTKADATSIAAYGNTEVQTTTTLQSIEKILKGMGLQMADIVKMQVFLVKDPALGKMDFAGFMRGYTKFFGTKAQPNLPVRSAFEIAGLANPGWLVEIEVSAVRR